METIQYALNQATNLETLRKVYYRLALVYHPDKGGSVEMMAFINNLYNELFAKLKNGYESDTSADKRYENYSPDADDLFKEILSILLKLSDINVEICGCWIWISGETKQHKDVLKENKCMWSRDKSMWYWKPYESKYKKHRDGLSMDEIRDIFGSYDVIKNNHKGVVLAGG